MNRLFPEDTLLRKYIDYYWIVDQRDLMQNGRDGVHDFPSLAPELVLALEGEIFIDYLGKKHCISQSTLITHIETGIIIYPEKVRRMIVVKFKNNGMASFLPFTRFPVSKLIAWPFIEAEHLFGAAFHRFNIHIGALPPDNVGPALDRWFLDQLIRCGTGLILEIAEYLKPECNIPDLLTLTNTSHATLGRHFKKETGLSPKQYLIRNRSRHVVQELCSSDSMDWLDYVVRFNYHDQSHFIKEIKRFSGFTPTQLVTLPWFGNQRPPIG